MSRLDDLVRLERDIERRPLLEDVTRDRRLEFSNEEDKNGLWADPRVGLAVALSMLFGVVLVCAAMGWVTL